MAQVSDFLETDVFILVTVQEFVSCFCNAGGLLLGNAIAHDPNDLLKVNVVLVIESLEEYLNVVHDVLLEDGLVDLAVHVDEGFEADVLLLQENLLQGLRPDRHLVHVEYHLEVPLETRNRCLRVLHQSVKHTVQVVQLETGEIVFLFEGQNVVAKQISVLLHLVLAQHHLQVGRVKGKHVHLQVYSPLHLV